MPLDAGRPPPNTDRPPQPPKPPDRSQTDPKPGDQPRPTDKPSSTSQAGQSSKPQSNFDKYLANPRQDSDQPGKGDGGTKAGKDGQAGDAGGNKAGSMGTDKAGPTAGDAGNSPTHDGGKGQPEGTAPTGEASGAKPTEASQGDGAKPQGDNSSRAGGKPEGQSGGGAKPEGQSGDGGKQQGSSGGDSKAGVRSEGGAKPEGQSGGGNRTAEQPVRSKVVHKPDGRRVSELPETRIQGKPPSKETRDAPVRFGRWVDHLLEANREQRKQQMDDRYDAEVKRDIEARNREEGRAHRLVQEQSQMPVLDHPPGMEKVPARAAAATMLWNYLVKGIKPTKEDWLAVGDAAARGARSRGGVRGRTQGIGKPKPATQKPAKAPGPPPKTPAKPAPPTGGKPASGKAPEAPPPKPPGVKQPTSKTTKAGDRTPSSQRHGGAKDRTKNAGVQGPDAKRTGVLKPTDARKRTDAGKPREVRTETGKKLTDRVWLGGAKLAERTTRRANRLAEATGVGVGRQKGDATIGVLTFGRKVTRNGVTKVEYRTIITTNNPKVENALAKNLRPGERLVRTRHEGKLRLHAEHNAMVHATTRSWVQKGWKPVAGGASNHVCKEGCQPMLKPLGAVVKGGGYYFPRARKALGLR